MRFIHTADWHIGRHFRFLSDETAPLLQAARLEAITTIGDLAREHEALHVLVAGDTYDGGDLGERTLRQPLERMHRFTDLVWHLIPGNHDPVRPQGIWDRVRRLGLPPNVRLYPEGRTAEIAPGQWLLTAPGGAPAGDPTSWMDSASTPEGTLRIGLAHGSARSFGSRSGSGSVIDPARVRSAGLDYLALGDWHGRREEAVACWYAGTPEPDRFDQPAAGSALLVEVDGPGGPLSVRPVPVGRYRWAVEDVEVDGLAGIETLEARLRARQATGELERLLLQLRIAGTLNLAERDAFDGRIVAPFGSALTHLRLDLDRLQVEPADDDLDGIAEAGALRLAAERLRQRIASAAEPAERERAKAALLLLRREARGG